MKQLLLLLFFIPLFTFAQQTREFESFKKVSQLRDALYAFKLENMAAEEVNLLLDTAESKVSGAMVNKALKAYLKLPKKYVINQASEANHGYIQTFGIYDQEEIALYFVTIRINPLNEKIEELQVKPN